MIRLLKILVSAGLIGILLWNIEWQELRTHLYRADVGVSLLAVFLLALQYPLSAWKWQKSLRLHGLSYRWTYLLKTLCIGFFFNNFLPTTVGGDAYRAYMTMHDSPRRAFPISAVILERILGLAALLVLGYISAAVLVFNATLPYRGIFVWSSVFGFGCLLAVILAFRYGAHRWMMEKLAGVSKLEPLIESVRVIKTNKGHMFGLVALSFVFQALAITCIAFLFAAIDVTGKLFESGLAAAAAGVAGMLPISINGIGVVESSFVVAAVFSELPYEEAVIVALFLRVFMLVSSVVFGAIYILSQRGKEQIPEEAMIE